MVPPPSLGATASAIFVTFVGLTRPSSTWSGRFHVPSQQTTIRFMQAPRMPLQAREPARKALTSRLFYAEEFPSRISQDKDYLIAKRPNAIGIGIASPSRRRKAFLAVVFSILSTQICPDFTTLSTRASLE